jgi:formylglycine-generating enzyme required for sulfatase activity
MPRSRGGAWIGAAFYSRSAARTKHTPDFRSDHFGLRVAVEAGSGDAKASASSVAR